MVGLSLCLHGDGGGGWTGNDAWWLEHLSLDCGVLSQLWQFPGLRVFGLGVDISSLKVSGELVIRLFC